MIPAAGHNPYYLSDFERYQAQAYDTSMYANYGNINHISPFNAWIKNNITGIGTPPPGMSVGDYGVRMQILSDRFATYAPYSVAAQSATAVLSAAFMFPAVTHAALTGISAATGGAPLGQGGIASSLASGILNSNPMGALTKLFDMPVNAMHESIISPLSSQIGGAVKGAMDTYAAGSGSALSANLNRWLGGLDPKGWLGFLKTGVEQAGSKSAYLSNALMLPATLATNIAGWAAFTAATDTVIKGAYNAAIGIDVEQDRISDIFESLSSRVLQGGSGHNAKSFAKEMAKEIRDRSFIDATPTDIMGYLGISDTFMGRLTGGWSALDRMQTKTAQYSLMAESGLLSKSSSAEEFIQKADAMYNAIAKLGDALGQTTTKAMETARVLKSQGVSDPLGIANAGNLISTTSSISGYSHEQIMAISSEATEAFRGSLFSSNAAYDIANQVIRRTALGQQLVGERAYEKALYENRGLDSMNVAATRVMAGVTNSRAMRQMLIGSMYKQTQTGFAFTGEVDADELNKAMTGQSFLNQDDSLALVVSNFEGMSQSQMRAAERKISEFTSNLSGSRLDNLIGAFAHRHGYGGGTEGRVKMFDTLLREQGMSPETAQSMAKMLVTDTRSQEFAYNYFNQRERELSKYASDTYDAESKTGLSGLLFDYSKLLGRNTAFVETAALMATGAGIGLNAGGIPGAIIGAGIGLAAGAYSGSEYYKGIGQRLGFTDFSAPMGAVTDISLAAATGATLGYAGYKAGVGAAAAAVKAASASGGTAFMGGLLPGAYAAATTVGTALGGGYIGDRITSTYYSDYSSEGQLAIGTGYGALTGAGIATGLGAIGLAPLTLPAIAIGALTAGAYGLYQGYNRLYGAGASEADITKQREALRQQMQLSQSMYGLQQSDPEAYRAMLDSVNAGEYAITPSDRYGATAKITDERRVELLALAQKGTRQFYNKAYSDTPTATDLDLFHDIFKSHPGYDPSKPIPHHWDIEYGPDGSPIVYDLGGVKNLLRERYSNVKMRLDSDAEKYLAEVRFATSLMGGQAGAQMRKEIAKHATGLKIYDAQGKEVVYENITDYFDDAEATPFERATGFLNKKLKSANEQFKAMGGIADKFDFITAANAGTVYSLLHHHGTEDYKSALTRAQSTMGRQEFLAITAFLDNLGPEQSEAVKNIKGDLALAAIANDQAMYQRAADDFMGKKRAILGKDADVVAQHMSRLFTGDASDAGADFYALKANKFESIRDEATKQFMQQSTAALDVLDSVSGTWGDYEAVVSQAGLDSQTGEILLSHLKGRKKDEFIRGDDISQIKHDAGKQILAMHANDMSRSTQLSIAEEQDRKLGSIEKIIGDIYTFMQTDGGKKPLPEGNKSNNNTGQPIMDPNEIGTDANFIYFPINRAQIRAS